MSEKARKAEATGQKTVDIAFRGETFTLNREYDDWPVEFVDALEEGKTVGICKGALGPIQWRKVRAMNLTLRDLAPLAESIAAALGFGSAGESQASSD